MIFFLFVCPPPIYIFIWHKHIFGDMKFTNDMFGYIVIRFNFIKDTFRYGYMNLEEKKTECLS